MIIDRLRTAGCVWAEDETDLLIGAAAGLGATELESFVSRRITGEPLEQVIGWAEFCGLRLRVAPGVFVPRRRTEFLVQVAVHRLTRRDSTSGDPLVVLDLCCGIGALSAAVAAAVDIPVEVHAADVDPAALACARDNLPFAAALYQGDLYSPLPESLRGRVDVLLANAPYVPTAEIELLPREARDYENLAALDGGSDGLATHRRIVREAATWLAPTGELFIEVGQRQVADAATALAAAGLMPRVRTSDEHGATVVVGLRERSGRS